MNIERILNFVVILIAGLLLGMFLYLAPQVFVADSEFWAISLGYYLKDEFQHSWVYSRPLYYFAVWLSQPTYESASQSVYWARGFFALNAVVMLFFILKIMRQRTGSYFYGVFAIVLLLGNTGFLNQGFRIRSDLMATTLALAGYYFYSVTNKKFFILSPLLATPKAFIHVLSFVPMYFAKKKIFSSRKFWMVLPSVLVLVLLLYWTSLDYFLESFTGTSGGPGYFDALSFSHIINQVSRNSIFWILFLLRFWTWRQVRFSGGESVLQEAEAKWLRTTLYLLVWMLLFTEKVQFFIASFLPYFAMHVAMMAFDLRILGKRKIKLAVVTIASSLAFIIGGWWTSVNLRENNNKAQIVSLDNLYAYMASAGVKSFEDFNCLLPPYCKARQFLGPHQTATNQLVLRRFKEQPSEVFYYLKKADLIEPELSQFLSSRYVNLGRGLFILKNDYVVVPESLRGILDVTPINFGLLFGYDIEY